MGPKPMSLMMFRKHSPQQSKLLSQDGFTEKHQQLVTAYLIPSLVYKMFDYLFNFFFLIRLTNLLISLYLYSKSNLKVSLPLLDEHLSDIQHCKKQLYKLLNVCWEILNMNLFSNHFLTLGEYSAETIQACRHILMKKKILRLFCNIRTLCLWSSWSQRKN